MKTIKSRYLFVAIAFVFVLSAVTNGQTKKYALSFDSFGPVKIGMTVKQASKALGVALIAEDGANNDCYFVSPKRDSQFRELGFMVTNNRISRINTDNRRYVSAAGAKVGDSEAKIKRLYKSKVKVTKHFYTDGHYLTVNKGRFSIIFETDGKRVTYIRVGKSPEVNYVEGCS